MTLRSYLIGLAAIACFLTPARGQDDDTEVKGGPPEFKQLKYRMIGPAIGGRVSRVTGVPGDPLTYYAATAAGGVWKSADGGLSWKPIFDDQPISSIGSIAVAPSDPNVVYVGSGEANIRGNVAAGNGIYKSTDAGKTWKHVWKQEGQIGTITVHPRNPNVAFAAVLGHAFGPNPERGVYRTTDGGKTWQKVLYKDQDTGASDVCFDPSNPHVLFAGLWQARRKPWELTSGGPGSGLYVSRDGGDTWKQIGPPKKKDEGEPAKEEKESDADSGSSSEGGGLPKGPYGKIGVAVAPSDSRRVYALIEADKGGLFRSDDGGEKWERVNQRHYLTQRAWYYMTLTVDPTNPNVIWCPQVRMLKSIDGGKTFQSVKGFHHGDHHDIWIDPKNPRRMINGNDGGVDISTNGGESWYAPPLPVCQFYHIACDNRVPYHVSGTVQDIGTASGPSNNLSVGNIGVSDWHTVGGGETGFTAPDPSDPNIIYAGEYGGYISRYDHRNGQSTNVSIYPTNPSGHGAADLRYRFQWTAPILISPYDPKTIYHGANVLFRTNDGGKHWIAISKDLTRDDKSKQQWSGGPITGDNTTAEYYCTIFAIAESPKQRGVLWAGSDDGLVHVSRDDGKTWTAVTQNIPGLPEWATIDCIEASPFDAGTAYVVADAHRLDDMKPYLFKTTDYGKTWKNIAAKLPQDVYLHAVREDPKRPGLLYAATERGVAYSPDGGETWRELKMNLPTVAVHDLVVKDNDLVLGTCGRSIWILDDLTPVREWSAKLAAEPVHLFPPMPTIRWQYHGSYQSPDKQTGDNPPHGALINFSLKQKARKPVTIEIHDELGGLVRKLAKEDDKDEPKPGDPDGPFEPGKGKEPGGDTGVNRFVWDLTYDGAVRIKKAKSDQGDPKHGPRAKPGYYTIKLEVDGKAYTTRLQVLPDPRVPLNGSDLNDRVQLALTIRDDITRLSNIVHQLRAVRSQLTAQRELLKDEPKAAELRKSAKDLIDKLDAFEAKLHNPKAEVTYDILAQKGGAKLYSLLTFLYELVKDGDDAPTQGMREVYEEQFRELKEREVEWDKLRKGDVQQYNAIAKKLDLPKVVVPAGKN